MSTLFNSISSWWLGSSETTQPPMATPAPLKSEELSTESSKTFFQSIRAKLPTISIQTPTILKELKAEFRFMTVDCQELEEEVLDELDLVEQALASLDSSLVCEMKAGILNKKSTIRVMENESKKFSGEARVRSKEEIKLVKKELHQQQMELKGLLYREAKEPNRTIEVSQLVSDALGYEDVPQQPMKVSTLRNELLAKEKLLKAELHGISPTAGKINAFFDFVVDKTSTAYFLQSKLVYPERPLSKWSQYQYEYQTSMETRKAAGLQTGWISTAHIRAKDDFKKAALGAPLTILDAFGKASNRVDSFLTKAHSYTHGTKGGVLGFVAGIASLTIGAIRIAAKVGIIGIGVIGAVAAFTLSLAAVSLKWVMVGSIATGVYGVIAAVLTFVAAAIFATGVSAATLNMTYLIVTPILVGLGALTGQVASVGGLGAYLAYHKGKKDSQKMIDDRLNTLQSVEEEDQDFEDCVENQDFEDYVEDQPKQEESKVGFWTSFGAWVGGYQV